MGSIQNYFRDAPGRLGVTNIEIAEMCGVERSTVSKWINENRRPNTYSMKKYRQTLFKSNKINEIAIFDKAYRDTYAKDIDDTEYFDVEYKPLPFDERLTANQNILPKCLYDEADVYNFTVAFPNYTYFEMMISEKRYSDITTALDKIFPAASQTELLRYEKLYGINTEKLKSFGLISDFFVNHILQLSCIPRHLGEIPEELRVDIYNERFKQKYINLGEKAELNNLINTMIRCKSEALMVSILKSNHCTKKESELVAIESFINSYISEEQCLTLDKFYDLFNIKNINKSDYEFTLTQKGSEILSVLT